MADTLITMRFPTGVGLQLQIGSGLRAWNGTTLTEFQTADWATYLLDFPEVPAGSGLRVFDFAAFAAAHSSIITPNNYWWASFPLNSVAGQLSFGSGGGYWSGVGFVSKADGTITVDQDYPTTGNLVCRDSSNQGVTGTIRAYLLNEYLNDPTNAFMRGETLTHSDGSWVNGMDLLPADYMFVFVSERNSRKPISVRVG